MRFITVYFLITFSLNAVGQFYAKDHLEYGFNIGTYIANNNTSILYDAHTYVATSLESMLNEITPTSIIRQGLTSLILSLEEWEIG